MRFRIASFNVENLLGHGVRYYDRLIYTPEESETKFAWIAATLDRARADIVGIQEVWFEDALKDVAARSNLFKTGANVVAPGATLADNLEGRVAKRPRLGLISRFPIKSAEVFPNFPATVDLTIPLRTDTHGVTNVPIAIDRFQRPPLRAVVDVEGFELVVYVAHLKSKGPMMRMGENGDDPHVGALGQARATIVRAAEAAALRHLILTDLRDNRKPLIVLGDLNDTPDAASTQIVRGPSPQRDDNREEKTALWDVVLYSSYRIAAERAQTLYTHIYDGERGILDHILLSEEFYSRNRARLADVLRYEVINDHLHDDDRAPRVPGASDHGIPIAEIELLRQGTGTNA